MVSFEKNRVSFTEEKNPTVVLVIVSDLCKKIRNEEHAFRIWVAIDLKKLTGKTLCEMCPEHDSCPDVITSEEVAQAMEEMERAEELGDCSKCPFLKICGLVKDNTT